WDLVFLVYGLYSWRVLTSEYFDNVIYRADRFWPWLNRAVPRGALVVLYRAAFFYGASRWIAWTIWAHVIHHYPYDLSWGGPHWVHAAHPYRGHGNRPVQPPRREPAAPPRGRRRVRGPVVRACRTRRHRRGPRRAGEPRRSGGRRLLRIHARRRLGAPLRLRHSQL